MSEPVLLVIGATGDVGRGIVAAALATGRTVIASARNAHRLDLLANEHSDNLHVFVGDLASENSASELWKAANFIAGPIDEVVVSVNAPLAAMPLKECDDVKLQQLFAANVLTHFNAAKVMLPDLGPGGKLVGIGGGMADAVFPHLAPVAMCQAALRNLYRGLAREGRAGPVVRELMIASMVNGKSKREIAEDSWITDRDIGIHVCALLDDPERFDAPISVLKSRAQVGKPDKTLG